jgi:hypothetical protein
MSPTRRSSSIEADSAATEKLTSAVTRIYDQYRTSLLNVKLYGYKLRNTQRLNLSGEIIIAVTASGGISSWWIWGTGGGKPIWAILVGIAALLSAIKPVLPLTRNIATYSKLFGGHNSTYLALKDLAERIKIERALTPEMEREFQHLLKRHQELSAYDEPYPSPKLIERFQREVNIQIPAASLWWPAQ